MNNDTTVNIWYLPNCKVADNVDSLFPLVHYFGSYTYKTTIVANIYVSYIFSTFPHATLYTCR